MLYSLLSLIYTVLTEIVLGFGIFIVYKIIKKEEEIVAPLSSVDRNINIYSNSNYIPREALGYVQPSIWDNKVIWIMLIIALVLGIVLFITYFLLLTKKFVYYLDEISHGIEEMSLGNFEHRIHIKYEDEFGNIADKINNMAGRIREIMEYERRGEDDKNQLITSVAHDLRTPLTSIIGYLDIVLNNQVISDEVKVKYVGIAYNKSKSLEKLIDDLFSYTNYSFGEKKLELTSIDMVKFMEQIVDEFYPSFKENELEFEYISNRDSIMANVDGAMLARAVTNLIENGIKYGKDGKRIKIELTTKGDDFSISITNYGRLIPKKELEKIFQRFYRVENSRSSETGGTGIGLAIVKSIVELHSGEILVRSDRNGTVFEIRLKLGGGIEWIAD